MAVTEGPGETSMAGRSERRPGRRRPALLVGALASSVALLGAALVGPASAGGVATISLTSASPLPPGGVVSAEGDCAGGATEAHVTAAKATDGPFEFSRTVAVSATDGSFTYEQVVPQTAPAGEYRLGVLCTAGDVALGTGETTFGVDGDPVTPPWIYELLIDGGGEHRPGDTVTFTGTCWAESGASNEAVVAVERVIPVDSSDVDPFSVPPVSIPITSTDGTFSGEVVIPEDAPAPGRYVLSSECFIFGDPMGEAVAFIDLLPGETPTTTTDPGATTTQPGATADPPAAAPIQAQPSYTG